jgi:hypothetical protein
MQLLERIRGLGQRGYKLTLWLMSGATAVVVAACYGMADTFNLSYSSTTRDIFARSCDGCHSGDSPAGGYRTDSYAALFENGSDTTPNVVAYDPASQLLAKLGTDPAHELSQSEADLLYDWIVNHGAGQY